MVEKVLSRLEREPMLSDYGYLLLNTILTQKYTHTKLKVSQDSHDDSQDSFIYTNMHLQIYM